MVPNVRSSLASAASQEISHAYAQSVNSVSLALEQWSLSISPSPRPSSSSSEVDVSEPEQNSETLVANLITSITTHLQPGTVGTTAQPLTPSQSRAE